MVFHLRSGRGEYGAAAVEFAILVPILILLVFGIVEFGRAYHTQVTLTHAAREGARVWALGGTEAEATAATETAAPTIQTITVTTTACNPPDPTELTAQTTFSYNIPLFDSGTIDLIGTGVMRCGG